ncbi:hypothetical protein CEXT_815341 [Caerostris extrusa]|uniref:Uncharacterized protein n=1 Tax=Caerostris extrusa TaxID=172846 RepID=A0AAV4PVF4_CAEEX|nr:hypothetical protein CEXT_815341 [Caerostris extrusa]
MILRNEESAQRLLESLNSHSGLIPEKLATRERLRRAAQLPRIQDFSFCVSGQAANETLGLTFIIWWRVFRGKKFVLMEENVIELPP